MYLHKKIIPFYVGSEFLLAYLAYILFLTIMIGIVVGGCRKDISGCPAGQWMINGICQTPE